ncbi:MAG: FG-GAP repeat protein [Phycisphaerales bacterium]|nr:FG-GAP repeat protein [Phycisphaerales bacterium]
MVIRSVVTCFVAAVVASLHLAGAAALAQTDPCLPLHTFTGEGMLDNLGFSVAGLGDVDGDQRGDVAVGIPYHDGEAGGLFDDRGRVMVYSGATGLLIYLIEGEAAEDFFGYSIAAAGDVDGDGVGDLIVGAYHSSEAATTAGCVSVYSGVDGYELHHITGEAAEDFFGYAVAGAGDLDGDEFADFIVGAPGRDTAGTDAGRVYVFAGSDGHLLYTIDGESAGDQFGSAVAGGGRFDADVFDDLVVGAYTSAALGPETGRVYLFSGVDGSPLLTLTGEAAGDQFGWSVAVAGRIDVDEFDDVLAGAPLSSEGGVGAGRASIHSGADGLLIDAILGPEAGAGLGYAVARLDDVNNDQVDDLIIGAPWAEVEGVEVGIVQLVSGADRSLLDTYAGEAVDDHFGSAVAAAGLVDDGWQADLAIGARWNDAGGLNAGRAYLYPTCVDAGCAGDLDGDGDTDQSDLGILLAAYDISAAGDLDNDGDTDQSDLGILLADYNCGT